MRETDLFWLQENWTKILSVFPTKVPEDETPRYITWI